MTKTTRGLRTPGQLYPPLRPFASQMLDVGDGHSVYMEQCGKAGGLPVVVLHGGPGGGCSPAMRRYFDPDIFHIILFDQRGCGLSRPHASVENNTTWHLIRDIERIRETLGIERWAVFGGSWGATLALIYAQTHPRTVVSLILRGIFLMTRDELAWFYGGGAGRFWPDWWAKLQHPIPQDERDDMIAAYHRRLFCGDPATEAAFARAWLMWEAALAAMGSDAGIMEAPGEYARAFARLENHYFYNGGFLGHDGQILDDMPKIASIPGHIVQGRYDMICPPSAAWRLAEAWPAAKLHMIGRAGHALSEPGITDQLVRIMNDIAQDPTAYGF